jgi:hypothetical protein
MRPAIIYIKKLVSFVMNSNFIKFIRTNPTAKKKLDSNRFKAQQHMKPIKKIFDCFQYSYWISILYYILEHQSGSCVVDKVPLWILTFLKFTIENRWIFSVMNTIYLQLLYLRSKNSLKVIYDHLKRNTKGRQYEAFQKDVNVLQNQLCGVFATFAILFVMLNVMFEAYGFMLIILLGIKIINFYFQSYENILTVYIKHIKKNFV